MTSLYILKPWVNNLICIFALSVSLTGRTIYANRLHKSSSTAHPCIIHWWLDFSEWTFQTIKGKNETLLKLVSFPSPCDISPQMLKRLFTYSTWCFHDCPKHMNMRHAIGCWLLSIKPLHSNTASFHTAQIIGKIIGKINSTRANSKSSVLILLDLSGDFDTVNHIILQSTYSDFKGTVLWWLLTLQADLSGFHREEGCLSQISSSMACLKFQCWVLFFSLLTLGTIIQGLALLSVISTWWSHCLNSYLCLSFWHLCLDGV